MEEQKFKVIIVEDVKLELKGTSLCEWMLYAGEPHITDMGAMQDWASTYPLFHWGPIPWSFYIILAVSFGFMLHVRKRNKQKYSERCV